VAEPINLNRARKAKARAETRAQAAQNRLVHGRTKAEKAAQAQAAERDARILDGAKREP
jgi:hypothetical protein